MNDEPQRKLTLKQRRFAEHYVGEAQGNAKRAAELAGYNYSSEDSLKQMGYQLLNKPNVSAAIVEMTEENACSSAQILHELASIAFAPFNEYIEILTRHGETIRVKMDLASKVKALELLGKNHQLFREKLEVTFAPKAIIGINLDEDL